MFIFLVALAVALFLIFRLARAGSSNDWLRSWARHLRSLLYEFYYGANEEMDNETDEHNFELRRSLTMLAERSNYGTPVAETQRASMSYNERLSGEMLKDSGSKWKDMSRYSLENMIKNDRDEDLVFPITGTRAVQPGITNSGTIRTTKQEGKENLLQTLKTTVQKTAIIPPTRLNTSPIYNMILQETLKETATQQKPPESDRNE